MKVVQVKNYKSLSEVRELIKRPHLEDVKVSSTALERTKQIFGKELTPYRSVAQILHDIREQGNDALLHYIASIDGVELTSEQLLVSDAEIAAAETQVSSQFRQSLQIAIDNITQFHTKQLENSWIATEDNGTILGQKVTPIEKVGIYVPGGNAPLVSSVLMSALPAKVAGVQTITMATPLRSGKIDPHLLVAAKECGVHKILKAGGAHAIGALAYGTDTISSVDKLVGPGNLYVTLAKKMVYGQVGIDSIAGPSEILIIADEYATPSYIAADLLSQAEHDWEASAALITPSADLADSVQVELQKQLATLSTAEIAQAALDAWGLIVVTENLQQAVDMANVFAPEHLELMVANPWDYLSKITNAGAIFLGEYSPEPIGDYIAGPNHILPTNGTARFASPLTTNDFIKKSSLIYYTAAGLERHGHHAVNIAECEGLEAHGNAVKVRLNNLRRR